MSAPIQGRGLSVVPKQAHGSGSDHADTIRKQADGGTYKTRNRPFGTIHTRIARVERWVELMKTLEDCAQLERRSGAVIGYCVGTRNRIEAQMMREQISVQTFHRQHMDLDRVETRIAQNLIRHAARADNHAAECKVLASQAERASGRAA